MSLLQLVLLVLQICFTSALVIESPECRLVTHVSGEFTNLTLLKTGSLHNLDIVPVSPFTACEPLHGDLTGKVALVLRGECNFVQKVWNAQRAHAAAVIVMDSELRHEPPYHIIMMKDSKANSIHIPSVFISYTSGEWLLLAISRAAPWDPPQITLNAYGELPQASTSNRLLKRVIAYICAFSSGLSLLSSAIFQWVSKSRRTRAAKKLPVAKYERNMQRTLLEHLLKDEYVLDRIFLNCTTSEDGGSDAKICLENDKGIEMQKEDRVNSETTYRGSADSDTETCPICLDDFEDGTDVKVLPCQHFFHINCINPWLEGRSGRCPLCKQDAIASVVGASKQIFGVSLPRVDQILQHEQWFHTCLLILPASLASCLVVNAIIGIMWP
ncbi:hypothetical protein L915_18630 [Plasmopara halstedii]|uniref:RING-type domain-containing protein n=1 Tax=Plasmopara halstedii TaxID=4781 RepID=A0A0P1A9D1_PLAHL|nr:hypothetical protein L915_18630 [Plasmopara halstedii]CEG36856.1 hypothetical protein L915_18630 [Plasmopara halstedii]|eukprot:XP_024573225.1 hypothetical protein L915_18630 [Plasmopara halstedii]